MKEWIQVLVIVGVNLVLILWDNSRGKIKEKNG